MGMPNRSMGWHTSESHAMPCCNPDGATGMRSSMELPSQVSAIVVDMVFHIPGG